MVFNATFNNNSVILLWSVLLYEETRVPGENHWPVVSHWRTLSHNVASSTPHHEWDIYICFWNSSFLPKIEPSNYIIIVPHIMYILISFLIDMVIDLYLNTKKIYRDCSRNWSRHYLNVWSYGIQIQQFHTTQKEGYLFQDWTT
jgi:hypothetical protein